MAAQDQGLVREHGPGRRSTSKGLAASVAELQAPVGSAAASGLTRAPVIQSLYRYLYKQGFRSAHIGTQESKGQATARSPAPLVTVYDGVFLVEPRGFEPLTF
jgi:hypothetical protein